MCHDQGASALILAPQHQLLISGGKKGDINIFDVRQRQQRQRFQAHESAIKCLALDPHEEFFVSGAGDGDIKVMQAVASSNRDFSIKCRPPFRFQQTILSEHLIHRYGVWPSILFSTRFQVNIHGLVSSKT